MKNKKTLIVIITILLISLITISYFVLFKKEHNAASNNLMSDNTPIFAMAEFAFVNIDGQDNISYEVINRSNNEYDNILSRIIILDKNGNVIIKYDTDLYDIKAKEVRKVNLPISLSEIAGITDYDFAYLIK